MGKIFKFNGEEYEEIPQLANAASIIISDMYIKLGQPDDPFSAQGEKMMNLIISVWQDLYPEDAREWFEARKDYQNSEMTTKEQVRQRTGRSLASIPRPIYDIMQKVFKNYKLSHRDDYIKLVRRYPIFRMANHI